MRVYLALQIGETSLSVISAICTLTLEMPSLELFCFDTSQLALGLIHGG